MVGVGNLGSSLMVCKDLLKQNYEIVAAFDIHPRRVIGRVSEQLGRPAEVFHVSQIKEIAKARKIEIGLITTPPSEAQVRGILNFAPAQIRVPEGYIVRDVFFTSMLDNLTYLLSNRHGRRRYREKDDEMVMSRVFSRGLVSAIGHLG